MMILTFRPNLMIIKSRIEFGINTSGICEGLDKSATISAPMVRSSSRRDRVVGQRAAADDRFNRARRNDPATFGQAQVGSPAPRTLRDWLQRVDDRFMGSPIDISPHDAILYALKITAGEVAYCDAQIRRLEEDELFERPLSTTLAQLPNGSWSVVEEKRDVGVISRWVQLRDQSINQMAKFAKMALDVGIEERQIKLAEREADMIGAYFEAVLDEIKLTTEQKRKLGPAMREHLKMLEPTKGERENGNRDTWRKAS